MKKIRFNGRKHAMTAACLLIGMFVLTSAVYANYDDAKGYTNYKNALKDLMFYDDNYSLKGNMSFEVDGKQALVSSKMEYKIDGDNNMMYTANGYGDGDLYEYYMYTIDGTGYSYNPKEETYSEYESYGSGRPDMNDKTMKKAVKFMELFADTMVGDLKNNFVLASKDGGDRSYTVNVSGSQIPEVVNAGISLMFTAYNSDSNHSNDNYITYENYDKAYRAYYEEQSGKEYDPNAWDEEMGQINEDFWDQYNDVLEEHNDRGIVYVKADGTYEYFKNYKEYQDNVDVAGLNEEDIMVLLGSDAYIDNVACNFTLDANGKIVSNDMEATMAGKDESGNKHTVTMKMSFEASDYGTTTIEPFDTTGKTKSN